MKHIFQPFKSIQHLCILCAMLVGGVLALPVYAAAPISESIATSDTKAGAASSASNASNDMAEGLIRKIDRDFGKITIKHGDIKNLDMTAMTMVFKVKNPAMLDQVKAGDKIRFKAEKINGAIVVTDMQLVEDVAR